MSTQTSPQLDHVLDKIKSSDRDDFKLVDVLALAEEIIAAAQNVEANVNSLMADELKSISDQITETRNEINQLPAYDQDRVPAAGKELDEIVKATEGATNQIMSQAEVILGADTSDFDKYQEEVTGAVMQIFEACSFQDITGQRIAKVVKTLEYVESRVASFTNTIGLSGENEVESEEERRQRELLLNGPSTEGEGIDQGDIDKLLGDSDGEASQNDIDALFD